MQSLILNNSEFDFSVIKIQMITLCKTLVGRGCLYVFITGITVAFLGLGEYFVFTERNVFASMEN